MKTVSLLLGLLACSAGVSAKMSKLALAEALRPILSDKLGAGNFDLKVERVSADIAIDASKDATDRIEELEVTPQRRDFKATVTGENGESVTVTGKISWLVEVPAVLRPISSGDVIDESDVGLILYPLDDLNPDEVLDARELLGKSAARGVIEPNSPIERKRLKNPKIIKRGAIVEIVYSKGNLTITTKAAATRDLALGDTGVFETLKTADNQTVKRLTALVTSPNGAEIIYG